MFDKISQIFTNKMSEMTRKIDMESPYIWTWNIPWPQTAKKIMLGPLAKKCIKNRLCPTHFQKKLSRASALAPQAGNMGKGFPWFLDHLLHRKTEHVCGGYTEVSWRLYYHIIVPNFKQHWSTKDQRQIWKMEKRK